MHTVRYCRSSPLRPPCCNLSEAVAKSAPPAPAERSSAKGASSKRRAQEEWLENCIKNRARQATIDIKSIYTNYKIDKEEAITAIGSTAIIEAAYAEGVIGIAT